MPYGPVRPNDPTDTISAFYVRPHAASAGRNLGAEPVLAPPRTTATEPATGVWRRKIPRRRLVQLAY